MHLPPYLIKRIPKQENIRKIRSILQDGTIHTVCEEAKCPNIGECFARQTCTFMILGNNCTRNCAFCGVDNGNPCPVDQDEPKKIAEAVKKLRLKYVVITSVTRDDLLDGGAEQFAKTVENLRLNVAVSKIEILIPDFIESLNIVLDAKPYVLNHNIETVPRLYQKIRPQAKYERSLAILKKTKELAPDIYTKSGFMVGLGETEAEVFAVLKDLFANQCELVTIGQYLPPSKFHLQPERFVTPEEFEKYKTFGLELGFKQVAAGPFVRSSYHAEETVKGNK
ncbi:MAG: lipoyl synthase [bacterium]